jgi:methylated-DNA-protein-cysteine methyltransferase-like protein
MTTHRVEQAIHTADTASPSQIDVAPPEARIWQVVALIPAGRVTTYGTVAKLAGLPGRARLVGRVLARLPTGTRLPWHRVVNAALRISLPPGESQLAQRQRLEAEGVSFVGERIAARHRWPD